MKSVGKIIGILLLVLLLVVVGLVFALTQLIDPNDYKSEIQDLVREKANIELTLSGNISWSLFPWLGLSLHQASIARPAMPAKPFAKLDRLKLSVRLLPLLRREIKMSAIRADGLNLTLERDVKGKGNWEESSKQNKNPTNVPSNSQKQSERALKVDIDSLIIDSGRLDYFDAKSGLHFSAESLQLTSGSIRDSEGIPLKFSAFISTNQPVLRSATEFSANFYLDTANKRYRLDNILLSGELVGESLAGKSANFTVQGQLLFEQAAKTAKWNNLKLSFNQQLQAAGEISASNLDKHPSINGQLTLAEFSLAQFVASIGHPLPEMSKASALKKVSLSGQIKGTKNSLALENLKLKLDNSNFTGRLALANFSKRSLQIQLNGDQVNLDQYLPPAEKNKTKGKTDVANANKASVFSAGSSALPKAPTQAAWPDEPLLPLGILRTLDLSLDLSLEQLIVRQIPLDKVQIKATAADGLINLKELKADLYSGSIESHSKLDVRTEQPTLSTSNKIVNVPIERLLDKPEQKSPISGALTLNAKIQSRGNSQRAWVSALNGKVDFELRDGVLPDANLEQQLCQGIAILNRKSLNQDLRNKDTAFDQLNGSLLVTNGVAVNPDFSIHTPGLSLKGSGSLDLPVLGMDYRLGLLIEGDTKETPDPACQVNPRYVGMELPLRCRGSLELGSKACRLDKDGVMKLATHVLTNKFGERIEKKLDNALEKKLGADAAPELKDALRGLFKR